MALHRKGRAIRESSSTARTKGRLVEAIVAAMHDADDVVVDRNVNIRPLHGGRPREIDVLLRATVSGYPIQIAFECKNEKRTVGVGQIDAFIAKLQHVGLPVQSSIYISSVGYTRGAQERAREAGVRLLVLTGLTDDRLRAALVGAFQTIVYLLPVVGTWRVTNDIDAIDSTADLSCFYDEDGKMVGAIGDLVWRAWHEDMIPLTLGKHAVDLRLPVGWRHIVRGCPSVPFSLNVDVHIVGLAVGFRGEALHHDLLNAQSGEEEKTQVKAHFPPTLAPIKLGPFRTEDELGSVAVTHPASIRLLLRVRLPRIELNKILWPPTREYSRKLSEALATAHKNGKPFDEIDLTTIEAPSLANLFEPAFITETLRAMLDTPLNPGVS